MRLQENPFYILGVTPEHSIAEIDEVKEDKCFEDEMREAEYEEARDILANPRKRLSAEVRWFGEKNTQVFSGIESLYAIRDGNPAKEISERIRNIDSIYAKYANPEAASFLLYEINESRTKARMAQIDTQDAVTDAIREAMAEDFRAAATVFCGQISIEHLAEVANTLAEEVIRPSIGVFPKKYNEIVRIFIDLYHIQIQSQLEVACRKILDDIEKAKEVEDRHDQSFFEIQSQLEDDSAKKVLAGAMMIKNKDGLFRSLFTDIRNFDYLAKPLQIYFRDIGQVRHQKETQEIEGALRSLAVYYNNEKESPFLSWSLTKFYRGIFTEDPEFVKITQDDQATLEKLIRDYEVNKKRIAEEERKYVLKYYLERICGYIILFFILLLLSECS